MIRKPYAAFAVSPSVVEGLISKTLILVTCDTIYSDFTSLSSFEELELKQEEEADKKAEEYEVKRRKTDTHQLTLAEVKKRKDLWSYSHPQHKKVTGWIAQMIAIDS